MSRSASSVRNASANAVVPPGVWELVGQPAGVEPAREIIETALSIVWMTAWAWVVTSVKMKARLPFRCPIPRVSGSLPGAGEG